MTASMRNFYFADLKIMVKILYSLSTIQELISPFHVRLSGAIGFFNFIARLRLDKQK